MKILSRCDREAGLVQSVGLVLRTNSRRGCVSFLKAVLLRPLSSKGSKFQSPSKMMMALSGMVSMSLKIWAATSSASLILLLSGM